MATDSFFAMMCGGMLALLFGMVVAFSGYRLFLVLIPIWGFFFGFGFGAQTMQAIFGDAFLATITSWIVGFIVAIVFAVLSYLFYIVAVALLAGSLGYAVAVGLLTAIGMNMGFIVWIIGVVAGVALALVVLRFNLQKIFIQLATAFEGAAIIVGVFLALFGSTTISQMAQNPSAALQGSPFWMIIYIGLGLLAFAAQYATSRAYEIQSYDRWTVVSS